MLKIFLTEEYGYRQWIWTFPGTKEELIITWKSGNAPLNFMNPSVGDYPGAMEEFIVDDILKQPKYQLLNELLASKDNKDNEVEYEYLKLQYKKDFDSAYPIQGHIHMPDDTYIEIDKVTYYVETGPFKKDI